MPSYDSGPDILSRLKNLRERVAHLEANPSAGIPLTLGAGSSAATWPSAHFGDADNLRAMRGTSAAPAASGHAVVCVSDYTSGDWDDANMASVMIDSHRSGGSSQALMVGTVSGAKGKATCGIQSHTLISTGTGAGAGDHASAFAGWFSGQLWDVYDRLSVVEINPINCTGSDTPSDGEYTSTGMLSNALALIAAGSKKSSSALVIGTQDTTNAQFQRGIDFAQSSISSYAVVLPNNAPVTSRNAADNAKVELYRLDASNNWATMAMTLTEQTAPSAPAANQVTIYAVDNGAGKTQLMALFSSGAAQQLAIQP